MAWLKSLLSSIQGLFYEESEDDFFVDMPIDSLPAVPCDRPETKKAGIISTVKGDYVLIDDEYGFKLPEINEKIRVGKKVWFTVRLLDNGSRVVTDLGLLKKPTQNEEEVWPEMENNTATVTKFIGRDVYLSNSMRCNLDQAGLKKGYSVAEGDVVSFRMDNVRGQDVIVKLQPSFEQKMIGFIFELNGSNGLIQCKGEVVWFTGDVLPINYSPLKGDNVEIIAMLTDCPGKPEKRAIDVRFLDNQEIIEDEQFNAQVDGLNISMNTDFKTVDLMDYSKSLTLKITNNGKDTITLLKANFRRPQFQITVCGLQTPQKIFPASEISLQFDLRPKFIGMNTETFDFYFDGFRISRSFHMKIKAEFLKEIKFRGGKYQFPDFKARILPEKESSTFGSTPFKKKHFRKQNQRYIMPPKMKRIFVEESHRDFKRLLDEEFPLLRQTLDLNNYARKFHLLLFLEEMFLNFEYSKLNRDHVFFKSSGQYLLMKMPGLMEQRPSPIVGDRVIVTQPWLNEKEAHVGFIHIVTKDTLYIDFNEAFKNNYRETDCSVEFQCQLGAMNLMHGAVDQVATKLLEQMLFPSNVVLKEPLYNINKEDLGCFNKNLNEFQKNAVVNILQARSRPYPYVIFGPPGTGKTSTVTELILQIMRYGDSNILVTAPSNSAADLLTKRLIQYGKLETKEIVRIVAYSRSLEAIDPDIEEYCTRVDEETNNSSVPLGYHKITVGTCVSVGALDDRVQFSHVIIDEAGCATEPQSLIPLTFLQHNGVAILAGDPKQLGPTVLSSTVDNYGLYESLLCRLMNTHLYAYDPTKFPETDGFNPNLVTCLKLNYRSVPDILAVPNRLFYNSALRATITGEIGREAEIAKAFLKMHPIRDTPASLVFHGIRGMNYQEVDSPSWLNPEEICQAYLYVKELLSAGVLPVEIGIISPYRKQVTKLREIIMQFLQIDTIKVGSVEEFQGQERMVIILSTVRSSMANLERDQKYLLGFLCDPRRFNVAITRARALIIVLGNPHLLSTNSYWLQLIKYCLEAKTYIGCDLPLNLRKISCTPQKKPISEDDSTTDIVIDNSW